MPKMKTSKTAAKRFKTTGSGRLRHEQQNNQHKFEYKSSSRKHRLDREFCRHQEDQAPPRRALNHRYRTQPDDPAERPEEEPTWHV